MDEIRMKNLEMETEDAEEVSEERSSSKEIAKSRKSYHKENVKSREMLPPGKERRK
jgi:hypothetical protein